MKKKKHSGNIENLYLFYNVKMRFLLLNRRKNNIKSVIIAQTIQLVK